MAVLTWFLLIAGLIIPQPLSEYMGTIFMRRNYNQLTSSPRIVREIMKLPYVCFALDFLSNSSPVLS